MTDTINRLIKRCKAGIYIVVNEHKNFYESIEDYIKQNPDIIGVIREGMIKYDSFIQITFYPDNPIGQYTIYHYDYDMALKEVTEILDGMAA